MAIVGAREAHPESLCFAGELAAALARAGVVVASGGALGTDRAAHEGALDAGGRTWVVAGTGREHCFPRKHAELFETIGAGPGAMIWPFPPRTPVRLGGFLSRNRILVALSDALVVIQAGLPSGAMSAAACALRQEKPLWVVPAPPWLGAPFAGSRQLLERGARAVTSTDGFLAALGLRTGAPARSSACSPTAARSPRSAAPLALTEAEASVLRATSTVPRHADEIASRASVSPAVVGAALLTLALENVVVEAPAGFFRRRDVPND